MAKTSYQHTNLVSWLRIISISEGFSGQCAYLVF